MRCIIAGENGLVQRGLPELYNCNGDIVASISVNSFSSVINFNSNLFVIVETPYFNAVRNRLRSFL